MDSWREHPLRRAVSRKLERLVDRGTARHFEELSARAARLEEQQASTAESMTAAGQLLGALRGELDGLRAIAASAVDDIPGLRRELLAARQTDEYETAFTDSEPLVTVRIATYSRPRLLVERALPSIAAQTYQHFEVIVVGDGLTNDTPERIKAFGDPRVRFVNLPYRFPYPDDADARWQVAGAAPMNAATELARGSWLAMLGDDDEFEPQHLEWLLETARATRSEMVYGQICYRAPLPEGDVVLGSSPPAHGQFNFQAAIVHRALRRFDFSVKSWLLDEPSDWNLCRRMIEAGVHIGYLDRVVVTWYPSLLYPEDRGD